MNAEGKTEDDLTNSQKNMLNWLSRKNKGKKKNSEPIPK